METLLKRSPVQSLLLRTAARRPDGRVIPPGTLRGGARVKVLTSLLQRGWIEPADDGHVMTEAGYAAIGQLRPVPLDDVQPVDATDDLQLLEGIPVRPGTKLAALVSFLRPCGYPGVSDASDTAPRNSLCYARARVCASRKVTTTCVRCVRRCAKDRGPISATQPANRLQTRASIEFSILAVFRLAWVQTCEPGTHQGSHLPRCRHPAQARADRAFGPLAHTARCEPQTLQTLLWIVAGSDGFCRIRSRVMQAVSHKGPAGVIALTPERPAAPACVPFPLHIRQRSRA